MTEVRWYRSWPAPGEWLKHDDFERRAYVMDHLPRIEVSDFDYGTAKLPQDLPGFCLLEWDVALASDRRREFAAAALEEPNAVLVAPYQIFDPMTGRGECVHRDANGDPIPPGYPACETFGLGCIYLPAVVIDAFMASNVDPTGMTDATLSRFVRHRYGPTRVDWRFRPQHLHGD